MEDYFAALAKNKTNATELGRQVMVSGTNDWNALAFFSWRIFHDAALRNATAPGSRRRGARPVDGRQGTDRPGYLRRALWENDRRAEAITHQRKAVQLCTVEAKRIDMEANLNRYVRLSREARR